MSTYIINKKPHPQPNRPHYNSKSASLQLQTGLTPSPSPRGEGSEMPCWGMVVTLFCSCNCLTSFIIPLVGAWLLCLFVLVIALHPLLFTLVGALHIVLFSFVVALHITPLSPWRGVGGEALYKTGATHTDRPLLSVTLPNVQGAMPYQHLSPAIWQALPLRMLIASSVFRSHSVQSSTIVPRYG